MVKKTEIKQDVEEPKDKIATQEDINGLRDAISELTKAVGELTVENVKWYRAGKM